MRYDKEKDLKEAERYLTRRQLRLNNNKLYQRIRSRGDLDKVSGHKSYGDRYLRCVYALVSESLGKAYVGLTHNLDARVKFHKKMVQQPTSEIVSQTDLQVFQLSDYVGASFAAKLESHYLLEHKKLGYIVTNARETGGMGCGGLVYSREKVYKKAIECKNKSEFCKTLEYKAAVRQGYIKKLYSERGWKMRILWSKEEVYKLAHKYGRTSMVWSHHPGPYQHAKWNGYLEEIRTSVDG